MQHSDGAIWHTPVVPYGTHDRCQSPEKPDILRKLALRRCELELLRSGPLQGMRKRKCEGDWAMCVDVRNPSFPRAIPHGMLIIDLVLQVVIFGPFPRTISDLIWGSFRTSFGDHFGPHWEIISDHILDRELNLSSNSNSNSDSHFFVSRTRSRIYGT